MSIPLQSLFQHPARGVFFLYVVRMRGDADAVATQSSKAKLV
jgi:hypothetical protein